MVGLLLSLESLWIVVCLVGCVLCWVMVVIGRLSFLIWLIRFLSIQCEMWCGRVEMMILLKCVRLSVLLIDVIGSGLLMMFLIGLCVVWLSCGSAISSV